MISEEWELERMQKLNRGHLLIAIFDTELHFSNLKFSWKIFLFEII